MSHNILYSQLHTISHVGGSFPNRPNIKHNHRHNNHLSASVGEYPNLKRVYNAAYQAGVTGSDVGYMGVQMA